MQRDVESDRGQSAEQCAAHRREIPRADRPYGISERDDEQLRFPEEHSDGQCQRQCSQPALNEQQGRSQHEEQCGRVGVAALAQAHQQHRRRERQTQRKPPGDVGASTEAAHQQVGDGRGATAGKPVEQAKGRRVRKRQDVHQPRQPHPVGEWEGVRGQRMARHPLVDEVIATRDRLVGHQRAQQREQ